MASRSATAIALPVIVSATAASVIDKVKLAKSKR
jgi:hypothetical protein